MASVACRRVPRGALPEEVGCFVEVGEQSSGRPFVGCPGVRPNGSGLVGTGEVNPEVIGRLVHLDKLPFVGRQAIEAAYREQPPDDEVRLLEQRTVDGRAEARYAWLREAEVAAGELMITPRGGKIEKLVVTFDRGVVWN